VRNQLTRMTLLTGIALYTLKEADQYKTDLKSTKAPTAEKVKIIS